MTSQDQIQYAKELERAVARLAAEVEWSEGTGLEAKKMSTESLTIIRPIPRRPIDYDSSERSGTSSPRSARGQSTLNPASAIDNPDSLSRVASMTNLTSSTLSGIYASTEEPETPWGIGTQTPIRRVTIQEEQELSAIELNKEHSSMLRRRLSTTLSPPRDIQRPRQRNLSTLMPRAVLLFTLGMGFGLLVTTLSDGRRHQVPEAGGLMHPGFDWRYLVFWGAIGVVLGGLLPWFDSIYDDAFSGASKAKAEIDPVVAIQMLKLEQDRKEEKHSTDWALVIRGVGAFVGIAFAIVSVTFFFSSDISLLTSLLGASVGSRGPHRCRLPPRLPW